MDSAITQSVTDDNVFIGFWTNWSYGGIRGATLTLRTRDAGFLSAFLALFVAVAGTSFWRIACFLLHHALSSRAPHDAIYHQRQAILRNAATATTGLWSLLLLNWAWRTRTPTRRPPAPPPPSPPSPTPAALGHGRPLRRTLPLLAFAGTTLCAFGAAGLFTARIASSMGDHVLLAGRNCGWRREPLDAAAFVSSGAVAYNVQLFGSSADYALRCYSAHKQRAPSGTATHLHDACPTLPRRELAWRRAAVADCPFPGQARVCRHSGAEKATAEATAMATGAEPARNLRLETGWIDSSADLGVNLPPRDGFRFRYVVECAPLKLEGFMRHMTSGARRNHTRTVYMYGPAANIGPVGGITNITYHYSADPVIWFNSTFMDNVYRQYTLEMFHAELVPGNKTRYDGQFVPIPDLRAADADIGLVFLSANDIVHDAPNNDSLYAARTPVIAAMGMRGANFTRQYYIRDDPARVLGCAARYQFCSGAATGAPGMAWPAASGSGSGSSANTSAADSSCTRLVGLSTALHEAKELLGRANPRQGRLFAWVTAALAANPMHVWTVPRWLGPAALTARYSMGYGLQGRLPDDQWQREVEFWFTTSLAHIQRVVLETVTGPLDARLNSLLVRPDTAEEHLLCRSQKIRTKAYTSFSVLGLAIVLGIGGLLIVLAYAIEPLVECVSKRARRGTYQRLEWSANGTLQLQRLAHEELGYGGEWVFTADYVPVTRPAGEPLAGLDLRDVQHPRLQPGMMAPPPMLMPETPTTHVESVNDAPASLASRIKDDAASEEPTS